jgi:hypothetical protein
MKGIFQPLMVASFAVILFCAASAEPAPDCGCNAALQKDLVHIVKSERQIHALLQTIDERTFQQHKSGGDASLGIPLVDTMISASANWSEFDEKRRTFLKGVGFNSDSSSAWEELRMVTNPVAYTAWAACMQACATRHIGFHGWKELENEDLMVFTIYFNGPVDAKAAKLSATIVNGSPVSEPTLVRNGEVIKPNAKRTFSVRRESIKKPLTVTVNAEGWGGVTIESRWSKESPNGTATLKVFRSEVVEVSHGRREWKFQSPDRHEKPRFTNIWEISAAKGRRLRHVEGPRYLGPSPEVAAAIDSMKKSDNPTLRRLSVGFERAWHGVGDFSALESIKLSADEQSATIRHSTWSRQASWSVAAEEFESVQQPKEESSNFQVKIGIPFQVRLPADALSGLLSVQMGTGMTLTAPGASSDDGVLKLLSTVVASPDGTYYQYVVTKQPGMISLDDAAEERLINAFSNSLPPSDK